MVYKELTVDTRWHTYCDTSRGVLRLLTGGALRGPGVLP